MDTKERKPLPVRDGEWLSCPKCGAKRIKHIPPGNVALNDSAWCRHCKTEYIIDIVEGQCYLSRSQ